VAASAIHSFSQPCRVLEALFSSRAFLVELQPRQERYDSRFVLHTCLLLLSWDYYCQPIAFAIRSQRSRDLSFHLSLISSNIPSHVTFHYISTHQYIRSKNSITLFANTAGGYSRLKHFSKHPVQFVPQFSKMKITFFSLTALSLLQLVSAQPYRKNSASIYMEGRC
jgi:hypothetical protein